MKKILLAIITFINISVFAQEYTITQDTQRRPGYPATFKITEKNPKILSQYDYYNRHEFDYVLVVDADYATLVPRHDGLLCTDMRNEVLKRLSDLIGTEMSELEKLRYLAYVRMDCVKLRSHSGAMPANGYERTFAFYVNVENQLYIKEAPNYFTCNSNEHKYALQGEFYTCKSTKQIYKS